MGGARGVEPALKLINITRTIIQQKFKVIQGQKILTTPQQTFFATTFFSFESCSESFEKHCYAFKKNSTPTTFRVIRI